MKKRNIFFVCFPSSLPGGDAWVEAVIQLLDLQAGFFQTPTVSAVLNAEPAAASSSSPAEVHAPVRREREMNARIHIQQHKVR